MSARDPATGRSTPKKPRRPADPPFEPPPPLPPSHPAALAAILVVAASLVVSVTFLLVETDFWQHLAVGRAIWETHSVPTRQVWTWPTYGAPDVNASWGFRALIWPLWSMGGVWGLFLWRWLTTLVAFGLLWATARRMGARGLSSLIVVVLCSLAYRPRSQIRPETMVAVLIALEVWILESRRQALLAGETGRDHTWWLVPVAWIWANSHISYFLCFLLIGIHWLDAMLLSRRSRPRAGSTADARSALEPAARAEIRPADFTAAFAAHSRKLLIVAFAGLAISLVNPFGWRALTQPLEYLIFWRHELIFKIIEELQPMYWPANLRNLLPLLIAGWPLLIVWRMRHKRFDRVETWICAIFTALALNKMRFVGFYALLAVPYVARDLDEWNRARRWPAWSARPWARAALTLLTAIAIAIPEWSRKDLPMGLGIDWSKFPVAACDFMAAHGVQGHGFNKFELGGYQLYRFWPDKTRLPFMDIHQAGTPIDRDLYAKSLMYPVDWQALDRRYHFDYALIYQSRAEKGSQIEIDRIADYLDADSSWALVLWDDPSRLYVRRDGPLAPVAARYGCQALPGGFVKISTVSAAATRDTALRERLSVDLERQVALSPQHSSAMSLLSTLELLRGRKDLARRRLEEGLRINPELPRAHERLGRLDLMEGRPREALREFEAERPMRHPDVPIDYLFGSAYQQLGDIARARKYYRRELDKNPGATALWDSLAALDRRQPS